MRQSPTITQPRIPSDHGCFALAVFCWVSSSISPYSLGSLTDMSRYPLVGANLGKLEPCRWLTRYGGRNHHVISVGILNSIAVDGSKYVLAAHSLCRCHRTKHLPFTSLVLIQLNKTLALSYWNTGSPSVTSICRRIGRRYL